MSTVLWKYFFCFEINVQMAMISACVYRVLQHMCMSFKQTCIYVV